VSGIEGISGKDGKIDEVGSEGVVPRVDSIGWLIGGACDGIGARWGGPEGIKPPGPARDGMDADGTSPDPNKKGTMSSVDGQGVEVLLTWC
jgi:hypothetical protein